MNDFTTYWFINEKTSEIMHQDSCGDFMVPTKNQLVQILNRYENESRGYQKMVFDLNKKVRQLDDERYNEGLLLQQFYSRLGVEAYCEDIQEQAIKEIEGLKAKETKGVKKLEKQLAEKDEEIAEWKDGTIICKLGELEQQLQTQPREIVEKIKEKLKEQVFELDEYKHCYLKAVYWQDVITILGQILKDYEEKNNVLF